MKKFWIGLLIVGTSISVAIFVGLLYNFVVLLESLAGG